MSESSRTSSQSLLSAPDAPTTSKQQKSKGDRSRYETPVLETWDGKLPSTGSRLHEVGMCRPCVFVRQSCVYGEDCSYCHFAHPKKSKNRPCKGRRERFRKQVSQMEQMILANPAVDHSSFALPHSLQAVPELKARFDRKVALLATSQQVGEKSQDDGSTPAQSSVASVSL